MSKLNLRYRVLQSLFFFNHEHYNVLNTKPLKKKKQQNHLNWLFVLGLHFVVFTLVLECPEADVVESTYIYIFKVQQQKYLKC